MDWVRKQEGKGLFESFICSPVQDELSISKASNWYAALTLTWQEYEAVLSRSRATSMAASGGDCVGRCDTGQSIIVVPIHLQFITSWEALYMVLGPRFEGMRDYGKMKRGGFAL